LKIFSPEIPLSSIDHIDPQGQVRYGMGGYALGKAPGSVQEKIVGYARHHAGEEEVVFHAEQNRGDEKRQPGEAADGYFFKIMVYYVTDQKRSPE